MALFAGAMISCVAFLWLIKPLACRVGLVDHPGGRKLHRRTTPLIGGIAIFCAFFLLLLTLNVSLGEWRSFFFASAVVFIVGILDDFQETPAWARFAAQIAASLLIVLWGEVRLENLGSLFSHEEVLLGMLVIPFSVFSSVGVINAANMLDGLDGLAGGLLLIFFATLLGLSWNAGLVLDTKILLLLCGGLVGFLLFNFRFTGESIAKVFLGDAGSLFLGLAVTWFLIRFTQEPLNLFRPVTALWLFALPIMDTVAIMTRRVMLGRSPFSPDREHFHHILRAAGYSARTSVFIILGISLLTTAIGLLGEWAVLPEFVMFYGFLLLFAAYFWGMQHAWKVMKALRRVRDHQLSAIAAKEDSASV